MPALVGPAVPLGHWRRGDQPVLRTGDLVLRAWRAADVDVVVRAYDDPGVRRWHVQSKDASEARWWIDDWPRRYQAGTGVDWAVTDPDGVVGRIGLRHVDLFEGEAETAYWVLPEARGRRVAPRALTAVTAWAFGVGLHRVALRHSTGNAASCRVAQHAGFALEGTMRRAGRHADGDHDMHLHAAVAPETPITPGTQRPTA